MKAKETKVKYNDKEYTLKGDLYLDTRIRGHDIYRGYFQRVIDNEEDEYLLFWEYMCEEDEENIDWENPDKILTN